jgi:hypothetical protein
MRCAHGKHAGCPIPNRPSNWSYARGCDGQLLKAATLPSTPSTVLDDRGRKTTQRPGLAPGLFLRVRRCAIPSPRCRERKRPALIDQTRDALAARRPPVGQALERGHGVLDARGPGAGHDPVPQLGEVGTAGRSCLDLAQGRSPAPLGEGLITVLCTSGLDPAQGIVRAFT